MRRSWILEKRKRQTRAQTFLSLGRKNEKKSQLGDYKTQRGNVMNDELKNVTLLLALQGKIDLIDKTKPYTMSLVFHGHLSIYLWLKLRPQAM